MACGFAHGAYARKWRGRSAARSISVRVRPRSGGISSAMAQRSAVGRVSLYRAPLIVLGRVQGDVGWGRLDRGADELKQAPNGGLFGDEPVRAVDPNDSPHDERVALVADRAIHGCCVVDQDRA